MFNLVNLLTRIMGLVIFGVGIALLIFGFSSSQSWFEQLVQRATGRYSEVTTAYILGGIAAIIAGGGVAIGSTSLRREEIAPKQEESEKKEEITAPLS